MSQYSGEAQPRLWTDANDGETCRYISAVTPIVASWTTRGLRNSGSDNLGQDRAVQPTPAQQNVVEDAPQRLCWGYCADQEACPRRAELTQQRAVVRQAHNFKKAPTGRGKGFACTLRTDVACLHRADEVNTACGSLLRLVLQV